MRQRWQNMPTSTALLRGVAETAREAILTIDETSTIVFANQATVRLFGYPLKALLGHKLDILIPDHHALDLDGQAVELSGCREDGQILPLEVSFVRFFVSGREFVSAIARDISERKELELALRESEERCRDLFENAAVGLHSIGPDRLIVDVNLAGLDMFGYPREELVGRKTLEDLMLPAQHQQLEDQWRRLESGQSVRDDEYTIIQGSGRHVHVRFSAKPILDISGRLLAVHGTMVDVTQRRVAEDRYRLLFERNLAGVYRSSLDGSVVECNEAWARLLGYRSPEEAIALGASDGFINAAERQHLVDRLLRERSIRDVEVALCRRDGTPLWVLQNLSLVEGAGEPGAIEGTMFDITSRKLAEDQLTFQAYHDALTGLANAHLFLQRVGEAIDRARGSGWHVAVLFLDIDYFKLINDTLGHQKGDQVLQLMAFRLQDRLRQDDTVARVGGDEFTIVLPSLRSPDDAAHIAQKILTLIAEPLVLDQREVLVTASIGIAMFPNDGDGAATLLQASDLAMYRAKESGRNNYQFFTPTGTAEAIERMQMENALRHALERGEMDLYFQPLVDSVTDAIVSMEALLRWRHPQRGLISACDFISVAEESGLIVPIGAWVIEEACRQAAVWHTAGFYALRVSVNLSARQLQQKDFIGTVERVLQQTGLPATFLELEITETAAMQNAATAAKTLGALKGMGVRISIDDFGIGYSSLSYLKRFPIDCLKIDRAFVKDIGTDPVDTAIVTAIIAMAHALSLCVTAEGVETEQQCRFLKEHRCEQLQGYLLGRPQPVGELDTILRRALVSCSAD